MFIFSCAIHIIYILIISFHNSSIHSDFLNTVLYEFTYFSQVLHVSPILFSHRNILWNKLPLLLVHHFSCIKIFSSALIYTQSLIFVFNSPFKIWISGCGHQKAQNVKTVKLSLSTCWSHVRGAEVWLWSFLISAVVGYVWVVSSAGRFDPRKEPLCPLIEGHCKECHVARCNTV
jgi:hypothetical protein